MTALQTFAENSNAFRAFLSRNIFNPNLRRYRDGERIAYLYFDPQAFSKWLVALTFDDHHTFSFYVAESEAWALYIIQSHLGQ